MVNVDYCLVRYNRPRSIYQYSSMAPRPSGQNWQRLTRMVNVDYCLVRYNRPRSIYQYSSMAPRLSGQNWKFFKFLLSLNSQKRLGYKENNTKYRSLT